MKVLSLFSGIGAFEKALKNLGVDFDLVGFCEIDKYAAKSYCAIHDVAESLNLGDITKVDENALPKDIDLVTYGFPCQDISIAGMQKGLLNDDGTRTRSGLFFDALRIIEATKPKVAIAENVKNLIGKKFNAQFQVVLASLESAGYNNYFKVLNAKDYGVPQNRERVFIVSIRKDIDRGLFQFPVPIALNKRLKDVLETVVDEKYYLSPRFMTYLERLKSDCEENGNGFAYRPTDGEGIANTIQAKAQVRSTDTLIQVGQMYPNSGNPQAGRIYDAEGICPTMDTCSGGNRMPKVAVEPQVLRQVRTEYGKEIRKAYDSGEVDEKWGNMKRFEPRDDGIANTLSTVQKDNLVAEPTIARCVGGIGEKKSNGGQQYYQQNRVYQGDIALAHPASIPGGSYRYLVEEPMALDEQNQYIRKDGCVGTIMTDGSSPKKNNRIIQENLRIRKLTPKECFRLMGFDDESFHKAEAVNSNSQLYKQAGNSIVVDVLEAIFRMMLDEEGRLLV